MTIYLKLNVLKRKLLSFSLALFLCLCSLSWEETHHLLCGLAFDRGTSGTSSHSMWLWNTFCQVHVYDAPMPAAFILTLNAYAKTLIFMGRPCWNSLAFCCWLVSFSVHATHHMQRSNSKIPSENWQYGYSHESPVYHLSLTIFSLSAFLSWPHKLPTSVTVDILHFCLIVISLMICLLPPMPLLLPYCTCAHTAKTPCPPWNFFRVSNIKITLSTPLFYHILVVTMLYTCSV